MINIILPDVAKPESEKRHTDKNSSWATSLQRSDEGASTRPGEHLLVTLKQTHTHTHTQTHRHGHVALWRGSHTCGAVGTSDQSPPPPPTVTFRWPLWVGWVSRGEGGREGGREVVWRLALRTAICVFMTRLRGRGGWPLRGGGGNCISQRRAARAYSRLGWLVDLTGPPLTWLTHARTGLCVL